MKMPNGWDNAPVRNAGEYERLPAGGHICRIMNAYEAMSSNHNPMLMLELEIAEGGEYDGYFGRQYNARQNGTLGKWPCIFRQLTLDRDGKCNSYFKGLIACIERSNQGYTWDWQEKGLRGKYIGMVFCEEEYLNQQGEVRTSVKPTWPRTVNAIREGVPVPEPKRLSGGQGSYQSSTSSAPAFAPAAAQNAGFTQVNDDELPF